VDTRRETQQMRQHSGVFAVSLAVAIESLIVSMVSGFFLKGLIDDYRIGGHLSVTVAGLFLIALPIGCSILGLVASVGIIRSKEWARKAVIFLSTVPILGCAILVLWHPASVFPPASPYEQYALLTIRSGLGYDIYVLFLLVLTPASILCLMILTGSGASVQFLGCGAAPLQQRSRPGARPPWFWVYLGLEVLLTLTALIVGFRNY